MNPNFGGIFGSWINDPCGSIPTQGIPRSQKNNAVTEFAAVFCQEIKFQAGFPHKSSSIFGIRAAFSQLTEEESGSPSKIPALGTKKECWEGEIDP